MIYERPQAKILTDRLSEPVRKIFIVIGPRQVGKTTLVESTLEKTRAGSSYRYFSVDEPRSSFSKAPSAPDGDIIDAGIEKPDVAWLIRQWEEARIAADELADRLADFSGAVDKPKFVLALDEVQKIPNWSEAVKGLWDADRRANRPMHVVLLGSATLLMQQGLSESLAGRYELIRMTHWSFAEMNEAFDIDLPQYIYFGGCPGSADYIDIADQRRWKSNVRDTLIEPNISKDILMMTRVDKPALLKNLFELGCQYSGQELSYNKMRGQLKDAGNTTTLADYLDLLTKAGLLTGLEKYASRAPRRRASSPKLIALNTALMTALSDYSFEEACSDRSYRGRLVESAVGAHLYNLGYNLGFPDYELYYWRDGLDEVDFVLKKGRRLLAIEVKTGDKGGRHPGLEAFSEKFNPHRVILVSDKGMPREDFLRTTNARAGQRHLIYRMSLEDFLRTTDLEELFD